MYHTLTSLYLWSYIYISPQLLKKRKIENRTEGELIKGEIPQMTRETTKKSYNKSY